MGKSWFDSLTVDLDDLKNLASGLAEEGMNLVFGEGEEEEDHSPPVSRDDVDAWIVHLNTRFAPRPWGEAAKHAIAATKTWIDASPGAPDLAEVQAILATLEEADDAIRGMRDWHEIMDQLWEMLEGCFPQEGDSLDVLQTRLSRCSPTRLRLQKCLKASIADSKTVQAFVPRITKPESPFKGLFDQLQRNQKTIEDFLGDVTKFRGQIEAAIPAAEAAQRTRQQEEADFAETDDVHKCATDGALSDLSQQLSGMVFTTWFEKNAARFYENGKQGGKVQIPLSEFDCGDGGWPGFQRDGAIKGTGTVTGLDRNFGPMADPSSEGHVGFEFEFTTYFTCKSEHFKMASIFSFKRDMAFFFNEAGFEEGIPQDITGFSRTGGDDSPVRR